ncbi:MAG: protein PhnB [Rhodospirillales bacterium]|nr:protein PhnB [Rhodospirillales bacterium]
MQLSPYLNFNGQCEEALTFYAKVLGGEIIMMLKGKDTPMADKMPAEFKDKIMHGRISVGGTLLMGSDAPSEHFNQPQGFSVTLGFTDVAEAERIYNALSESAQKITMAIQETFWAVRFGTFVDKFGTPWMINCEKPM